LDFKERPGSLEVVSRIRRQPGGSATAHHSISSIRPNPQPGAAAPKLDITVRVGCRLVYEATGPATVLLNVKPRADGPHAVVFQALALGDNLPAEVFVDSHGNEIQRVQLALGPNHFRHDAIVSVSSLPDNAGLPLARPDAPQDIPAHLLRYTLPSRYADSDKLIRFAWEKFGTVEHGLPRVEAISRWIHENIEYRFLSGSPELSAWDVVRRGYGVCRDMAHIAVALNRTFNVPTRYATGHLPDIGVLDPGSPMDFHAYAEAYVGGHWYTTDARFHVPRIGRIRIAHGQDAVDGAFSTIYGGATLTYFEVWAYQVARGRVGVGDPVDLSLRIDNSLTVRTDDP
jgi:transglutaminase-like putative cysteine protease